METPSKSLISKLSEKHLILPILIAHITILVLLAHALDKQINHLKLQNMALVESTITEEAELPINDLPVNRQVLESTEVEGGKIVAYRLTDEWSLNANYGVYAIRLEKGEYVWPLIFSVVGSAYTSENSDNNLFEIVNKNELWVVNAQTNKIDKYNFELERLVENTQFMNSISYSRSISLPENIIGNIYSLNCENTTCTVNTARHQESGCKMKLSIFSEKFSDITCSNMTGEYIPENL